MCSRWDEMALAHPSHPTGARFLICLQKDGLVDEKSMEMEILMKILMICR